MGIEPMVRVLQTLALPLGDVATYNVYTSQSYATCYELSMEIGPCSQKNSTRSRRQRSTWLVVAARGDVTRSPTN